MAADDIERICVALKEAEAALKEAKSAEAIRLVWQRYYMVLGHRKLGKLLLGSATGEDLANKMGTTLA